MSTLMDQFLLLMVELKWVKDFTQRWFKLVDEIPVQIPLGLSLRNCLLVKFYLLFFYLVDYLRHNQRHLVHKEMVT